VIRGHKCQRLDSSIISPSSSAVDALSEDKLTANEDEDDDCDNVHEGVVGESITSVAAAFAAAA